MADLAMPYLLLLVVTALMAAGLAAIVARRPDADGAHAMSALLVAVLVWVLAYAGELLAEPLATKQLFAKIQYAGIVTVPATWLIVAARYTHADAWVSRRSLALLAAIPLTTLCLVWSNETHGLIWREIWFDSQTAVPALQVRYGPWFWAHALFSYGCLAVGSWLLARGTLRSQKLHRWQGGTLLLSIALPWLANALYLLRIWPLYPLDPSPVASGVSTIIFGWCLLSFRLLDVVPVAPGMVMSTLRDGVLTEGPEGAQLSASLDFAGLESGQFQLEVVPYDLRLCIRGALDSGRPRAAEKQLGLSMAVDDEIPAILLGDPGRLRQILVLLLDNAIKFTEAGSVSVTVTAHPLDKRRLELQLAVQDVGAGTTQAVRGRLFQMFLQDDRAATRRHGGSGLALSRRLATLMGGRSWLTSAQDKGSTVYIVIPAQRAPDRAQFFLPEVVPYVVGKRALIVGDTAMAREFLELQARAWGMKAWTADSVEDVPVWLGQGERFDVALLAVEGPGGEIVRLITLLRDARTREELPLVLVITHNGSPELYRVAAGRAEAILHGPFNMARLHAVLLQLLAPAHAGTSGDLIKGAEARALRVLLVEDDPTNQVLAEQFLHRLEHHVETVDNGFDALAALERSRYDLVLLDEQLPGMDGLAVARAVNQRWGRLDRPPLVALTANAALGEREHFLAAGMDDYLSKPVSLEALQEVIARHIPDAPPGGQGGASSAAQVATPEARPWRGSLSEGAFGIIVAMYLQDTQQLLGELRTALARGQRETIAHLAHKLRSSSAIVAAEQLSLGCGDLEAVALTSSQAELSVAIEAISAEFDRVRSALSGRPPL